MKTPKLTFLHTSPVHVQTFDALLDGRITPNNIVHIVDESLLDEARVNGLTPQLEERIHTILQKADSESAVIMCTCSTLGNSAERANSHFASKIMRADRPMADKAVATGSNILILATLESTLEPTRMLIESSAEKVGKTPSITLYLCEEAWEHFEMGDQAGYHNAIAKKLKDIAHQGDVIVLAQASMAAAANLCPEISIPILSSPQLAAAKAIQTYTSQTSLA